MFRVVHPLYPTADIPSRIKNTECTRRTDSTKMLCPQYSLLTRIAKGHNMDSATRILKVDKLKVVNSARIIKGQQSIGRCKKLKTWRWARGNGLRLSDCVWHMMVSLLF